MTVAGLLGEMIELVAGLDGIAVHMPVPAEAAVVITPGKQRL
jgi:hypothetical protein